jgi:magnesium chelatase family protein
MIAKAYSCALMGLQPVQIQVEVGMTGGLPDLVMVGLPDAAVRESRERVRSAIYNAGFSWPKRRVLVNLAPAHLRKAGSGYDLAVAVAVLKASGQLDSLCLENYMFAGELSLDGFIRPIRGILAMALAMGQWPQKTLVVAKENQPEARRGTDHVLALRHISQLAKLNEIRAQKGKDKAKSIGGQEIYAQEIYGHHAVCLQASSKGPVYPADLQEVIGQTQARRALEIAACGRHNLLLTGPPGSGKSLLARCLPSILPPLSEAEALEINQIYSVAGLLTERQPWIDQRPFRSPHLRITRAGMFGGGWPIKPGEISLAHKGVLYLDEIPEMNRGVLEGLRQPLEEGVVTLSQGWGSLCLPADFQLVGSANPCYCGFYGDGRQACRCTPYQLKQYHNKLSGPLLDRMDMRVQVPRVELDQFSSANALPECSAQVRDRVIRVRQLQADREKDPAWCLRVLQQELTPTARSFLQAMSEESHLSARGYTRVLQLARTIADMAGEEGISEAAVAEALQFRG